MNKWVVLGLMGLFCAGCTTRIVDFTTISTKNVDWSEAETFIRAPSRVEGRDMAHLIIFIPTGVPNMKEAIDRAIESTPGGVALVDGVVYSKFWWIPYIYGRTSYVVEGTPLIDPSLTKRTAKRVVAKSVAPVRPVAEVKIIEAQKAQPAPVVSSATAADVTAQLKKLKELRDAGLLGDAEFEAKRKELVRQL